jgi:tRNA-splicing ligase RtcB
MGTGSYVVVGTEKAAETFYSVNHGAGRRLSRMLDLCLLQL